MARHSRTVQSICLTIGTGLFLAVMLWPLAALAQGGCTGDPCLFSTPTATPSPTTYVVPTGAATPISTPIPTPDVPMPASVDFPQPNFSAPTSIPDLQLPSVPAPLELELQPPQPITFPVFTMPVEAITPVKVITSITVITGSNRYSISVGISPGSNISNTAIYSAANRFLTDGQGLVGDVLSYTGWISGEIGRLQGTDSFTIVTAPPSYAPDLPRPMANVGYTFEMLSGDMYNRRRYTVDAWAGIFGYTVSLPIQMAKSVYELLAFFGPFGLFVIWLVAVMLPMTIGFNVVLFLKKTLVKLYHFAVALARHIIGFADRVISIIDRLVDWLWKLWEAIPFIN